MQQGETVYSNSHYSVVKIPPEQVQIVNGEPMNWGVVYDIYDTIEATVGPYPHAVMIADQLSEAVESISKEMAGKLN